MVLFDTPTETIYTENSTIQKSASSPINWTEGTKKKKMLPGLIHKVDPKKDIQFQQQLKTK